MLVQRSPTLSLRPLNFTAPTQTIRTGLDPPSWSRSPRSETPCVMQSISNDEQALAAATADGWELDISPGTEMSNDTWYRRCPTQAPVREETLIEQYSP